MMLPIDKPENPCYYVISAMMGRSSMTLGAKRAFGWCEKASRVIGEYIPESAF